MDSPTDAELLRDYNERKSESAFARLVDRHIDFVRSAAFRMVRDSHLAEDVTQAVFVALARQATKLGDRSFLAGWLHQTARNLAANAVRTDARRRAREKKATMMNEQAGEPGDANWDEVAPQLDAAMGAMDERLRDALLLRFFQRKSAREIGQALGISEEAAQKRVSRALDHLRGLLARRGITVGAGTLGIALTSHAVHAAPLGMAAAVTGIATSGASLATISIAGGTTHTIVMTTIQKAILPGIAALLAVTGIHKARQVTQLRQENRALREQQSPLFANIQELQTDRGLLASRLSALTEENRRLKKSGPELQKLRGEVATMRSEFMASEADRDRLASESIQGSFRPRADWSDRGNAEPFAAVETMLWAVSMELDHRLEELVDGGLEDRSSLFPFEHPPIQTVGAVNLISSSQNQEGTRAVVTAFAREDFIAPPGGAPYSVNKLIGWRLSNTGQGWKITERLFFDLGGD